MGSDLLPGKTSGSQQGSEVGGRREIVFADRVDPCICTLPLGIQSACHRLFKLLVAAMVAQQDNIAEAAAFKAADHKLQRLREGLPRYGDRPGKPHMLRRWIKTAFRYICDYWRDQGI